MSHVFWVFIDTVAGSQPLATSSRYAVGADSGRHEENVICLYQRNRNGMEIITRGRARLGKNAKGAAKGERSRELHGITRIRGIDEPLRVHTGARGQI